MVLIYRQKIRGIFGLFSVRISFSIEFHFLCHCHATNVESCSTKFIRSVWWFVGLCVCSFITVCSVYCDTFLLMKGQVYSSCVRICVLHSTAEKRGNCQWKLSNHCSMFRNAAAWLIFNHVTDIMIKLHWLLIRWWINYKLDVLAHVVINSRYPDFNQWLHYILGYVRLRVLKWSLPTHKVRWTRNTPSLHLPSWMELASCRAALTSVVPLLPRHSKHCSISSFSPGF